MEQTDAEEPPTQWSELPPEILTNILSRVEQGFRLHCAQVSKGWSSAAALATTAINIDFLVHPQALRRWMSAHGSQITQLRVLGSTVLRRDNVPKALRALPPIQKLQRLELGRSAGTPSWNFLMVISNRMCKDLAQATSLTLLELSCVSVSYKGADLLPAALALLPRLRHLGLRDVLAPAHPQHNALTGGTLTQIEWPADLLLDHPGLTHLKLSGGTEGGALWSLVDLSATLQHLELSNFDASSESYLEDLQCLQALTFLALDGSGRGGEFDDSPAMFLGELTALRHLDLRAFESSEIYEDLQFLSGLTCLLLYDMEGSIWHHHTPTSSLVLLPALQHLVVRSLVPDPLYNRLLWSLDLAAFGAGKQLTHVHIEVRLGWKWRGGVRAGGRRRGRCGLKVVVWQCISECHKWVNVPRGVVHCSSQCGLKAAWAAQPLCDRASAACVFCVRLKLPCLGMPAFCPGIFNSNFACLRVSLRLVFGARLLPVGLLVSLVYPGCLPSTCVCRGTRSTACGSHPTLSCTLPSQHGSARPTAHTRLQQQPWPIHHPPLLP